MVEDNIITATEILEREKILGAEIKNAMCKFIHPFLIQIIEELEKCKITSS